MSVKYGGFSLAELLPGMGHEESVSSSGWGSRVVYLCARSSPYKVKDTSSCWTCS